MTQKIVSEQKLVFGISPFEAMKANINPEKFYKAAFVEEFPIAQPGMISYTDAKSIEGIDILRDVISAQRTANVLTNACRYRPSNVLRFAMRICGTRQAQKEVEEFGEADITKTMPKRIDFMLKKNMDHIVGSDESQMTPEMAMVLNDNIQDSGNALAATKDELIADALLSGSQTFTATNSWDNTSTNPYTDLNAVLKKIRKAQCGQVNVAVANSDVWSAFFSLDKVNGVLKGVEPHLMKNSFTVPTLPGVACFSTDMFEEDNMVLANKQLYCVLGQGPYTIEQYRASTAGFDGWLVRDYMEAKLAIDKAGVIVKDLLA